MLQAATQQTTPPPATQEAISSLLTEYIAHGSHGTNFSDDNNFCSVPAIGEDEKCSICYGDFEAGQEAKVLACMHKFHPACIIPWLMQVKTGTPRIHVHV